jgi:hypothetical protein
MGWAESPLYLAGFLTVCLVLLFAIFAVSLFISYGNDDYESVDDDGTKKYHMTFNVLTGWKANENQRLGLSIVIPRVYLLAGIGLYFAPPNITLIVPYFFLLSHIG